MDYYRAKLFRIIAFIACRKKNMIFLKKYKFTCANSKY